MSFKGLGGGLGKLKNYCEICKKQCKDENGYKLHIRSQYHLKSLGEYNRAPDKYKSSFSFAFEREFSDLFKSKYGYNKYYPINKVYNDFIHDRHHTHMNSTRWSSLHGFAMHLEQSCSDDKPN